MSRIDEATLLRRIERDIDVEKRIRKQVKAQHLSTEHVDQRIAVLKQQARGIRRKMNGESR